MTDLITALAAKLMEKIVDKILELKKDKLIFALQIKKFAFGKVNDKPALLVFASVTNKNNKPFSISQFIIFIDDKKIKDVNVLEAERKTTDKNLLFIKTGEEEPGLFVIDEVFVTQPLSYPYLLENGCETGLICFKLPEEIQGSKITLAVEIAGYGLVVSERLI